MCNVVLAKVLGGSRLDDRADRPQLAVPDAAGDHTPAWFSQDFMLESVAAPTISYFGIVI